MDTIKLPWGYAAPYDDNEIQIVSTISDPPKIRLGVEAGKVESNLGAISFNIVRPDGRHEEMALVQGRLTADKQAGALYIAIRPRGGQEVKEAVYIDSNHFISHAAILAPNIGTPEVGKFAIKTHHGFYLCVTPEGKLETRDKIDVWETFTLIPV